MPAAARNANTAPLAPPRRSSAWERPPSGRAKNAAAAPRVPPAPHGAARAASAAPDGRMARRRLRRACGESAPRAGSDRPHSEHRSPLLVSPARQQRRKLAPSATIICRARAEECRSVRISGRGVRSRACVAWHPAAGPRCHPRRQG